MRSDRLLAPIFESEGETVWKWSKIETPVAYDLDSSKHLEFGTQLVVVNIILQILDVEVNTLILAQLLHFGLVIGAAQLFFTLRLLLRTGNENFAAVILRSASTAFCASSCLS